MPATRDWLNVDRRQTATGRAELRLAESANQYAARPSRQQLPSFWEWLGVLALTRHRKWTASQKRMMGAATSRHSRSVAVVLGLAAILLGLIYYQTSAARTDELVQALATCDSRDLADTVERLTPYRAWSPSRLASRLAASKPDPDQQIRLLTGTAVAKGSDQFAGSFAEHYLNAKVPLALAALPILKQHGRLKPVTEQLQPIATNVNESADQRLRAAAALAQLGEHGGSVLQDLSSAIVPLLLEAIAESPPLTENWIDGFAPAKQFLIPQLRVEFASDSLAPEQRLVATTILARYLQDDVPLLSDLAVEASPRQFVILSRALDGRQIRDRDRLQRIATTHALDVESEDEKDRVARRQANAILLLREAGDSSHLRQSLQHHPDPRLRAFLIDHYCQCPTATDAWIKQLSNESDSGVRQALILMSAHQRRFGELDRAKVVRTLINLHCEDPDSGVHGATTWALRELQCDEALLRPRKG